MLFDKPIALTEALRSSLLKRILPLPDVFGSFEIETYLPQAIRDAAFFSARTPYAEYLGETATLIQRLLQPDVRAAAEGAIPTQSGQSVSPAQVRARMKQHLAALDYQPDPNKRGGLQDLSSDRRINIIIDTQLSMQRGKGAWMASQDPDVLDLYPADELYRAIRPRIAGRDWQSRWNAARDALASSTSATYAETAVGPFVARKNDPIWIAISRFGNPYPPFDYNSGMRVRDVGRARAVRLKVIDAAERVAPAAMPAAERRPVVPSDVPEAIATALQSILAEVSD